MSKVSPPAPKRAVRKSQQSGRSRPARQTTPSRATEATTRAHGSDRSRLKKLLVHPLSAFGLLVVGVCLVGVTCRTMASDLTVHATVPATPLTLGATITDPQPNSGTKSSPVTVSGTCPDEAYVKLYRNTAFSGVAICQDGNFHITTSLSDGQNILQAQDYNITDAAGPVTEVVPVSYQSQVSGTGQDQAPLPLLAGDYHFRTTSTDQDFIYHLQFQAGQPPFALHIDWGNKTSSDMKVAGTDDFVISHHYKKTGYYAVQVSATDSLGRHIGLQLVALVRHPGDPPINSAILAPGSDQANGTGANILHWLVYIWPTYLVVAVMVGSFWLGERREYQLLTKPAHRPRLRHT